MHWTKPKIVFNGTTLTLWVWVGDDFVGEFTSMPQVELALDQRYLPF